MNNSKEESAENQQNNQNAQKPEDHRPIFEAVPDNNPEQPTENLSPEEVAPNVDLNQGDIAPPDIPEDIPPPVYQENKTKYLIILISTIFFFLMLFVIFKILLPGGNNKKQDVKLTYWFLWEDKQTLEPLIKKYEKKNPNVKIDLVIQSKEEYLQKIIARSKKGKGPDIFRFHNTWLPELKELAAPLPTKVFPYKEYEKTFYPVVKQDLKIGNDYYGIPLEIDGLILIYNKESFDQVGITSPPTNWDELIDTASKLTIKDKNGNIVRSGLAMGTASNVEHFSDIFGWMLLQNGGSIKKISSSIGQDTLQAYRSLSEEPNNLWDSRMPNSILAFVQGKVAMIFAPSWEVLVIKAQNPDIKLKTAPLPNIPGADKVALANYWVEGVSRYSKNQVEAWKFLKFLVDKNNLTTFYKNTAANKLFGEPYSRVDLASTLIQNEYLKPVVEQANYYQSIPMISRTYDDGLNDAIISYLRNAINSTIQGVNYATALEPVQKGVEQIFQQYGIN